MPGGVRRSRDHRRHGMLQEHGYRVPNDVAVTGYNSLDAARLAVPSITTVDRKIAELATTRHRNAARHDGRETHARPSHPPAGTHRPTFLRLRAPGGDSGYCGSGRLVEVTSPTDLAQMREPVATAMVQSWHSSLPVSVQGFDSEWADRLFVSFLAELEGDSSGAFLVTLEDMLRQVVTRTAMSVPGTQCYRPCANNCATPESPCYCWRGVRTSGNRLGS